MDIRQIIKQLPEQPGVYLMKNSMNNIIYVGKAKNLRARVSQYFQKRINSPKIDEMITRICDIEHITTDTELEAFLLENIMIKDIKPEYNRQLKNYKGYLYIKISVEEKYPRILKVTEYKEDGSIFFGPFTSEGSVDSTIEFIKSCFPIRRCSSGALKRQSSGCLNLQLGVCLGPCRGEDIEEEYRSCIDNIIKFLSGNDGAPLRMLHSKLKDAADNLEYEKAARYRDQIRGVHHVLNKQRLIKVSRYGRNIIAMQKVDETHDKLFLIKGNRILHSELINISESRVVLEEMLRNKVESYFEGTGNEKVDRLSQEDIDEAQIIYSYLVNRKNGIRSIKIPLSRIAAMNYARVIEKLLQT